MWQSSTIKPETVFLEQKTINLKYINVNLSSDRLSYVRSSLFWDVYAAVVAS